MSHKLSATYLILILVIFSLFFDCRGYKNDESENRPFVSSLFLHVGDERYMMIDTKESVVTWKGSNTNGLNSQMGYIYLSKGELMIEDGQLIGGTVEVNMNTIEDKKHGRNNKLVSHLKGPDFFEVKKFPFSTITITNIVSIDSGNKKITGNLTIKDSTHSVTFPAKVEVGSEIVKAEGKLIIDRTKWNVRYRSGKFYTNLANLAMSDSVEFNISIIAKK